MKKLTHAQFRDLFYKRINELDVAQSKEARNNNNALPFTLISERLWELKKLEKQFNQVPDIAAELEKIIDNTLDIQLFDPLLTKYSEGFKGALNFIKDKIKELRGE